MAQAEILPVAHPEAPARAAEVITGGGLVIVPTDTVYGIAAGVWQPDAVRAIYAAKQRPPDKAIPVLLADPDDAEQVAESVSVGAAALMRAFWPGPLTVVVPKVEGLPEAVTSLPTVGVRIPAQEGTRTVIRACGGALAVTSANVSSEPPAQTAQQAAQVLGHAVGLVLDGGPAPGGVPSTVVGVEGDDLRIFREGPLSQADLLRVLNEAAKK